MASPKEPRLFVVVDGKLFKSQQGVQAAHAVAEWCLTYNLLTIPGTIRPNGTLVVVKTPDLMEFLNRTSHHHIVWREPDLENRITAVAGVNWDAECSDLRLM